MSDDIVFFISSRLPSVEYSHQSHKQGLIYSIQSLRSQKHPLAIRSLLSIGLQWNEFELWGKKE